MLIDVAVWVLLFIATLFSGWRLWRRLRFFLHVLQLEGYKRAAFGSWVRARLRDVAFRMSHQVGIGLLIVGAAGFRWLSHEAAAAMLLPAWSVAFASSRRYRDAHAKKPLKYTARLRRLLLASIAVALVPIAGGIWIALRAGTFAGVWPFLAGLFLADLGAPLWTIAGTLIMAPVERLIQTHYKKRARRRILARPDLTVVAITGSYGKTSVKFIVAEILRERFNVLATPKSYNTPMGICLVINNELRDDHQVLVLEMGARHPGDIRELCEIARPDVAIVTNVGVAHLDSMGTMESIATEKSEIIRQLKPGGVAILNMDDDRVAAMQSLWPGDTWLVSSAPGAQAHIRGASIHYSPAGASFVVRDENGRSCPFSTQLIGGHNIQNILLGVAAGRAMGLRLRQIAHAVKRIEPVPHRLQLRREGDILVIDDAFNANPVGARNAVEMLGHFQEGRRVIVTPGMIELGERQSHENNAFGKLIARNADLVILVGPKQTRPIREGLLEAGFPEENIEVVRHLRDAQAFLKSYLRAGDVVLYENDLPDQFDEVA